MAKIDVTHTAFRRDGSIPPADELSRKHCQYLEDGDIVAFDSTPFEFSCEDREFLLSQKQSGLKVHKNVSYRPGQDLRRRRLRNRRRQPAFARHHAAIFSGGDAIHPSFPAPYGPHLTLDFASYRPLEEQG